MAEECELGHATKDALLQQLKGASDKSAIDKAARNAGLLTEWTFTSDNHFGIAILKSGTTSLTITCGALVTCFTTQAGHVDTIAAFSDLCNGSVHNSAPRGCSQPPDSLQGTDEAARRPRVLCNDSTTLALSIADRMGFELVRTGGHTHITTAHGLYSLLRGHCDIFATSTIDEESDESLSACPIALQAAKILLASCGGSVATIETMRGDTKVSSQVFGTQRRIVDRVVECVVQTWDVTCFPRRDLRFLVNPRWLQSAASNGDPTWSGTSRASQGARLVASARANSVIRGKHSSVVRISLEDAATQNVVQSVFLKRIEPALLAARPAADWPRDIASYCAEVGFFARLYGHYSAHCAVPKLFHAHVECALPQPKQQGESARDRIVERECRSSAALRVSGDADVAYMVANTRFVLLTQDLGDSHVQEFQLTRAHLESAVDWLSAFHAAALGRLNPSAGLGLLDDGTQTDNVMDLASSCLWEQGSFWTADKRMAGDKPPDERLVDSWARVCVNFEDAAPDLFNKQRVRELGRRLVAQADLVTELLGQSRTPCTASPSSLTCGGQAGSSSSSSPRVVVHGDFKTANMFFHRKSLKLMPIDFQWCGAGLGALDLVYLLLSSSTLDVLQDSKCVGELIQQYHAAFMSAAQTHTNGGPIQNTVEYSLGSLERDMQLVLLDYAYNVIELQWSSATPASVTSQAQVLGRCVHNRSIPHLLWFVHMIDAVLHEFESQGGALERRAGGCARWFQAYS